MILLNWLLGKGRKETRIVLNGTAFRALVEGKEVFVKDVNVRMILQDIGFLVMEDAIAEAEQNVTRKLNKFETVTINSHGDKP